MCERNFYFVLPLFFHLYAGKCNSSLVQRVSHSLNQQLLKPKSLSLMGSFVGSPGAPHKILVIGVMHSSPSFATSTQTTEIHFIISLLTVPNGQRPNGSRLALHPCVGHIWSLGSTHNHSNKLGSGGSPIAAAPRSATTPKHLTGVSASPRRSQLPGRPLSRLGLRDSSPSSSFFQEKGLMQTHSSGLSKSIPFQIFCRCFLHPQSEEDFQEL